MLYKMSMLAALTVSASAAAVPVAIPNVPPPVQGATASRTINVATKPLSDKRKLQSTPPNAAYVQKANIPSDISSKIQDYCQNSVCDGKETEWHMLGDHMDDNTPGATWVQAHPDQMTWSGLDNPTVTESEQYMVCDNGGNSEPMTCRKTIEVERGITMTTSTSVESKVGVEFSVKVSIPEVMKVGTDTSFEVSTTDTTSKAVSQSETVSIELEVRAGPGEVKCGYVKQTTSSFESTWTLPMSLTDQYGHGIRCQYGSPCDGHYYHFANVDDMSAADTSYTMSGKSTARVMSEANIITRDGACPQSAGAREVKGQLI